MSTATAAAGPWNKRSLRNLLERTGEFATVVELVNSRGVITERGGSKVMQLARGLADLPGIHALSITDNPGGNAVLSADTLGFDLLSRGQDVIIHLSCKDWNRNGLQSHAWQLASEGFQSILALSGDYPADGYSGRASGVFDIDSVGLLKMLSDMNQGLKTRTPRGRRARMKRTDFFLGAVVNNYKRHEREVMPQYFKLAAKVAAGAAFVVNQIGYNARKMDELIKYMALKGINVPVLANVYVLSGPAARYFNAGRIPGVVVSDELLAEVERHARGKDKGKGFLLEFAARQCAVARGLGYRGAYLGGHLKQDDYARILELTASFGDGDWRDFAADFRYGFPDEFHFFEADPETGLSSTEINREYEASRTPRARRALRRKVPLAYKLNRAAHEVLFEPDRPAFRAGKKLFAAAEKKEGARRLLHAAEQAVKVPAFDCRDCGDCSLPDIAFLCPESQCVKNQRNGPCGGTRDGKCEVGEKECIWARAYDRLKAYGEEEAMLERPVVYRNGTLEGTSAWGNTFLGRDHHAANPSGSCRERRSRSPETLEERSANHSGPPAEQPFTEKNE